MRPTISADNRGPILNIASWLCMITSCIIVLVKLGTKLFKIRELKSDDYLIAGAMVTGILQFITSNIQVAAGLGQRSVALDAEEILRLQKATYAAELLYLATLYLARLGVNQFLLLLAPDGTRRLVVNTATVVHSLCGGVMILAASFQCSLPRAWALFSGNCYNQKAFWIAEGAIGTLLDIFLAVVPGYLLHGVHLSRRKKIYVMSAFMVRLLTIPALGIRLKYIASNAGIDDRAFWLFKPALFTEIHVAVSLITSCVPFLKPFADSLQTGHLSGGVSSLTGTRRDYRSGSGGYKMQALKKSSQRSGGSGGMPSIGRLRGDFAKTEAVVESTCTSQNPKHRDEETSRNTSEERLVIRQTTTLAIEREPYK